MCIHIYIYMYKCVCVNGFYIQTSEPECKIIDYKMAVICEQLIK